MKATNPVEDDRLEFRLLQIGNATSACEAEISDSEVTGALWRRLTVY
jgi:hypothetical protein